MPVLPAAGRLSPLPPAVPLMSTPLSTSVTLSAMTGLMTSGVSGLLWSSISRPLLSRTRTTGVGSARFPPSANTPYAEAMSRGETSMTPSV